jgi:ATP-dependent exoDNAse (exonuclease V) beta subunit
MIDLQRAELEDRAARATALDTGRSMLVQAPAGSGKTELLATRFLKLLAEVEDPGEILALTFTRYATAEMRHRVLAMLEQAERLERTGTLAPEEDRRSLRLAQAALANANRRGWRLLEQPQRLNIQSIDALCLRLAHQSPLSAGVGGALPPTTVAAPLYRLAARRTLDRLGGQDDGLNAALRALLLLRDSNLASCERLLAGMLATRDQWTRVFPLGGDVDWDLAKKRLEEPLVREIQRVLVGARAVLDAHPELARELFALAGYACGNLAPDHEIQALAGLAAPPPPTPEFLDRWRCLCGFLMTSKHEPRKAVNVNDGFPPAGKLHKRRMRELIGRLDAIGFFHWLREVPALPPPGYTDAQWTSLRHIFVALRQAVAELDGVFAEQGSVDIMEVSIAALRALQDDRSAGASLQTVRHLLVDEFQDTSRRQHELLAALLRDWPAAPEKEKPRTLFLVGDPMQSIYMFRQADVELFELARLRGFAAADGRLGLEPLRLSMNFRSNAGVVKPLNSIFELVFPHQAREGAAAVDFLPGVPGDPSEPPGAFEIHAELRAAPAKRSSDEAAPVPRADAESAQTAAMLKVLRRHLPEIEATQARGGEFTVAVLARAKSHLVPIAAALREEGIAFRAVELETLAARQEILDLRALARALLHPLDRVAWLAVFRAPWCGLELRDLHRLCGTDAEARGLEHRAVLAQVEERLPLCQDQPRERAARVVSILRAALAGRYSQPSFSAWIERAWNSLGGSACVDAAGSENARAYFRMLDRVSLDGVDAAGEAMEEQLGRLFASPDPAVGDRCGIQLMTMHKAKGLGFNVVLLPGLHRRTKNHPPDLIRYLERETPSGPELLAAPIDSAGDDASPLNAWVRRQREHREAEERKRLLYVACTRARQELHLFATATVTKSGLNGPSGSLLQTAWPALKGNFEQEHAARSAPAALVEFPAPPQGLPPESPLGGVLGAVAAATGGSSLRRLPSDWSPQPAAPNIAWCRQGTAGAPAVVPSAADSKTERGRPQASRSSRILGTTVHALFERAAGLLARGRSASELLGMLKGFRLQANGFARNQGLSPQDAAELAGSAVQALERALADPVGLWILGPREGAQAEWSWTGVIDGAPRTLRVDRSFLAGPAPLVEDPSGEPSCLWILDYKTATLGRAGIEEFLKAERRTYAAQLESYAEMLRLALGRDTRMRLGLYYPLLPKLLWWEV